jgi:hypothetical protein
MDKAARMQMLKARFRANGGIPFISMGIREPKPSPDKPKRVYMPWPDIIVDLKRLPKDMRKSGHKAAPILLEKRRTGESSLITISRKLCVKLPKVLP